MAQKPKKEKEKETKRKKCCSVAKYMSIPCMHESWVDSLAPQSMAKTGKRRRQRWEVRGGEGRIVNQGSSINVLME